MAPTPPKADDSVGVAMPVKMDPKTTKMRISGGNKDFSALAICNKVASESSRGIAGAALG